MTIRTAPSRQVQMTAKNFPSIGPMLKKRSSPHRGVGTVSRGRPSNKLKAKRRKSIPRSASTHSRFGSSQLNSNWKCIHNCTHSQEVSRCRNIAMPNPSRIAESRQDTFCSIPRSSASRPLNSTASGSRSAIEDPEGGAPRSTEARSAPYLDCTRGRESEGSPESSCPRLLLRECDRREVP